MKAVFLRTSTLLLAASLAACSTTRGGADQRGGIDVTTSHLGQPVARAQVAVEPFNAADGNNPEFRTHSAAVAAQLARLGWTVANTVGTSEQVALVNVEQGRREDLVRRSQMVGGAAGASAPAAAGSGEMVATMLSVSIKRRSDGTLFWQGNAVSEPGAGISAADRGATVQKLAAALFRDFPGESGRTIRVR